jgi:DNA (cytosine-5)-methyltransferase 1
MSIKLSKYSAVSLFTGAGGFDLGIELSGRWRTRLVVDNHPVMVETLSRNQGLRIGGASSFLSDARILKADLSVLKVSELDCFDGIDLVIGGPPCQDFSAIGKQGGYEKSKGRLIHSFKWAISVMRPKVFLFENVPNIKSLKWADGFRKFLAGLELNGEYSVHDCTLNCADYGAATVRSRVFVVGVRTTLGLELTCPPRTHASLLDTKVLPNLLSHRTVEEAFAGLPAPSSSSSCEIQHFAPVHQKDVIERFRHLQQGERDAIRRRNRLFSNRPAFTLFAGGEKGGTRAHIHPTEPREITPRECARIHGFPDSFIFAGNKSQMAIQIANSVPVPVGLAWGRYIAQSLDKHKKF